MDAKLPDRAIELMKEQFNALHSGNIGRVMQYQTEINEVLQQHGHQVYVLPEEYFLLMREGMLGGLTDAQNAKVASDRMTTLMREAGMDVPVQRVIPDECLQIQQRAQEAVEAGDHRYSIELSRQYDQCMQRYGFENFGMPDEYYELQLETHVAFENRDWERLEALSARSEKIMNDRGIHNIGNVILGDD